jgi:hypothetical protein
MGSSITRPLWSNNGKSGGGEMTKRGAPRRPLGFMPRTTTESIGGGADGKAATRGE